MVFDDYRGIAVANVLTKYKGSCAMDEILPNLDGWGGLFLGGFSAARNKEFLLENNIKHVVCCLQWFHPNYSNDISILRLELTDSIGENISIYFEKAIEFIHTARSRGEAVLVHCFAGISRSATIIAAYLMTVTQLDCLSSLGFLTTKRRVSNPNTGFRLQLSKYYSEGNLEEKRRKLKDLIGEEKFVNLLESDLNVTKMADLRRSSISVESHSLA